jgi:hypothetical protein
MSETIVTTIDCPKCAADLAAGKLEFRADAKLKVGDSVLPKLVFDPDLGGWVCPNCSEVYTDPPEEKETVSVPAAAETVSKSASTRHQKETKTSIRAKTSQQEKAAALAVVPSVDAVGTLAPVCQDLGKEPSGDRIVTVRISEIIADYLEGEAAGRGQSLEELVGIWFSDAIERDWSTPFVLNSAK